MNPLTERLRNLAHTDEASFTEATRPGLAGRIRRTRAKRHAMQAGVSTAAVAGIGIGALQIDDFNRFLANEGVIPLSWAPAPDTYTPNPDGDGTARVAFPDAMRPQVTGVPQCGDPAPNPTRANTTARIEVTRLDFHDEIAKGGPPEQWSFLVGPAGWLEFDLWTPLDMSTSVALSRATVVLVQDDEIVYTFVDSSFSGIAVDFSIKRVYDNEPAVYDSPLLSRDAGVDTRFLYGNSRTGGRQIVEWSGCSDQDVFWADPIKAGEYDAYVIVHAKADDQSAAQRYLLDSDLTVDEYVSTATLIENENGSWYVMYVDFPAEYLEYTLDEVIVSDRFSVTIENDIHANWS